MSVVHIINILGGGYFMAIASFNAEGICIWHCLVLEREGVNVGGRDGSVLGYFRHKIFKHRSRNLFVRNFRKMKLGFKL